jgi:hypothetical protein
VDGAVVWQHAILVHHHAVCRLDGAGDDNGLGADYLGVGFGVDGGDLVYVYRDGCEWGRGGNRVGCVECGDADEFRSSEPPDRGSREPSVRSGVGVVGRAGE